MFSFCRLLLGLEELLYPPNACLLCGRVLPAPGGARIPAAPGWSCPPGICPSCASTILRRPEICPACGADLRSLPPGLRHVCGGAGYPLHYLGVGRGLLGQVLDRWRAGLAPELTDVLARLLAEMLRDVGIARAGPAVTSAAPADSGSARHAHRLSLLARRVGVHLRLGWRPTPPRSRNSRAKKWLLVDDIHIIGGNSNRMRELLARGGIRVAALAVSPCRCGVCDD